MKKLCSTILFVLTLHPCHVNAAKPGFGVQLSAPWNVTDDVGLGTEVSAGFHLVQPLGAGFGILMEAAVATPLQQTRPSLQVVAVVPYRITPSFSVVAGGLYRYNPDHKGNAPTDDTHVIGGITGPAFDLGKQSRLIIPIGVARNTSISKTLFVTGIRVNTWIFQ